MNLLYMLNEAPPWMVALILVAAAEVYSIGLMILFRTRMGPDRLALNNEVAGFKFAVVGVFYAVLLAFVVVAVWEDYRDTEGAVRNEAKALVDLHQASYALPQDVGDTVRKHLVSYTEQVRDREWLAMGKGLSSNSAASELHNLGETILLAKADNVAVHHHVIDLLTTINDNRNERLDSSAQCRPCFGSCSSPAPSLRSAIRHSSAHRISRRTMCGRARCEKSLRGSR